MKMNLSKYDKILFVHTVNDYSGSTNVLAQVIETEGNPQSSYVITVDENGFLSGIADLKLIVIRFPFLHSRLLCKITSLYALLDKIIKTFYYSIKVDAVYINTFMPVYAAVIAWFLKKPIIWHIHEKEVRRSSSIKLKEFIVEHTKAHFVFVSNYLSKQYVIHKDSTYEIRYNKLSSTFLNRINYVPVNKRTKKTILMACSMTTIKGVDTFVNLSKKMEGLNFCLVLSVSQSDVVDFCKKYDPPVNCKILPCQKDMNIQYERADIVLNLSNPFFGVETFGMTIVEGFAYGLPAVVPNVGGPVEIVKDGYNGKVVDVTSLYEIESAILEILSDANYSRYSDNAIRSSYKYR